MQIGRLARRRGDERRLRLAQEVTAMREVIRIPARQPKGRENAPYRVERYAMLYTGVVSPLHRYTSVAGQRANGRVIHHEPKSTTVE
jgi:hypothetical protein